MSNAPKAKSAETSDSGAKAETPTLRIPLHDPVPTLFADGCHGANVIAGCVRLDLFVEHAWSGSKGSQQMVAGRVVIPVERFETFVRGVNVVLKKLQDDKAAKTTGATSKTEG